MTSDYLNSSMGKIGFQVFQRQEVLALLPELLLDPGLDDLKSSNQVLAGIHQRAKKANVDFVALLNHLINHDNFEALDLEQILLLLPESLQDLEKLIRVDTFQQYLDSIKN